MKYKFIVFEGIDGSGSSTQASKLVSFLQHKNEPAQLTSEPSDGPIGCLIRNFFKGRITFGNNSEAFDMMMANLFAADRYDHIFNDLDGVAKKLKTNHVVSTRYFFSSLVYHCNSEEQFELVKKINSAFPIPDLTFYLDITPDESIKRMSNRFIKDKYEKRAKLESVHDNYSKLFSAHYTNNVHILDGTKSIDEIHEEIIKRISD